MKVRVIIEWEAGIPTSDNIDALWARIRELYDQTLVDSEFKVEFEK